MEEGEGNNDRITIVQETIEESLRKKIPPAPPLQGAVMPVVQKVEEKPAS